jgi:uncharacterized protein DUF6152
MFSLIRASAPPQDDLKARCVALYAKTAAVGNALRPEWRVILRKAGSVKSAGDTADKTVIPNPPWRMRDLLCFFVKEKHKGVSRSRTLEAATENSSLDRPARCTLFRKREDSMKTRFWPITLFVVTFLAGSCPLLAHHGNASYDTSRKITVSGTVTEYVWANPHVYLRVDAKDESGATVHWVFEGQNAVTQASAGWTKAMFKPGDKVSIEATPAKNGRLIGRFNGRIVINGQEFKPLG